MYGLPFVIWTSVSGGDLWGFGSPFNNLRRQPQDQLRVEFRAFTNLRLAGCQTVKKTSGGWRPDRPS